MSNLEYWDKMKEVPTHAQKNIAAGRLKGMTDISPQWRFFIMTETFGPIGFGWKFNITKQWIEHGHKDERCAMTNIDLFVKVGDVWSDAIPGTGGSSFTTQERNGVYTSDEAFKMSLTDALSVSMKMLGVGANIYSRGMDYSKYSQPENKVTDETLDDQQLANIDALALEVNADLEKFCQYLGVKAICDIKQSQYKKAVSALEAKRGK